MIDIHLKYGEILQMIGKRSDARSHYETALYIAEKNNIPEQIVESQIKYADTCESAEEALGWLDKALELARRTNNLKGICDALKELSNRQWRLGKHDTALQLAQQSLDIARQINDRKREALGLFFLASIHGERGNYRESHEFFRSTLDISREISHPPTHWHAETCLLPRRGPSWFPHFAIRGSSQTVLHCAHRTSTVLSCAFCEHKGWSGCLPFLLF